MRYIIIGNGAAGNAAAAALQGLDRTGEVLIFSDEPQPAYYRPLIVNLMEEGPARDIFYLKGPAKPPEAEMQLGRQVVGLEPGAQEITLRDGQRIPYDRLLLATGAAAIVPKIPGWPGPGTFVLRTLSDAQALDQAVRKVKKAVVIGAGRVGLKAALALRQRRLEVTLVEQEARLAPRQFDPEAGEILAQALKTQGIHLLFGQTVTALYRDGDRLTGAALADGRVLEAGVVVAAVGVRPQVELARQAGLAVNQGVLVDRRLRTSAPEVYAAGDVAETTDLVTGQGLVSGLWTNAVEMGRIAGSNMSGAVLEYPGAWGVLNSLEVAGITTVAVGLTNPPPGGEYQVYQSRRGINYRKLVCRDDLLVGALMLGNLEGAGIYAGLIRVKAKIGNIPELLERPRSGLASRLAGSLPGQK